MLTKEGLRVDNEQDSCVKYARLRVLMTLRVQHRITLRNRTRFKHFWRTAYHPQAAGRTRFDCMFFGNDVLKENDPPLALRKYLSHIFYRLQVQSPFKPSSIATCFEIHLKNDPDS